MTDGKLSGNDADEKKEEAVSGKEDKKNFDASETADVREKEEVIDTAKADLKIEDVKPIKQGVLESEREIRHQEVTAAPPDMKSRTEPVKSEAIDAVTQQVSLKRNTISPASGVPNAAAASRPRNGYMEEGQLELDFGKGGTNISNNISGISPPQAPRTTGIASAGISPQPSRMGAGGSILFQLNGSPLRLPRKENGGSYYLMDLLQYSGINLNNPKGSIELVVNGEPGMFQQKLREGDSITIEEKML